LQNAAGSRIEPPVSLPSEIVAANAPTAAALPRRRAARHALEVVGIARHLEGGVLA